MPLITFISDFGTKDHYMATVKAAILSESPQQAIIDISHHINAYDVQHMAYVLGSVYKDFPEGTIHFVGQDEDYEYFITWVEGHFFVVPNNGVISLISERKPDLMIKIKTEEPITKNAAKVAAKLAQGEAVESFGEPLLNYKEFTKRKSRATKKEIMGHVIRVDHFGNLITNIDQTDFDILSKGRAYTITFGKESLKKVHQKINEVDPSDIFAIFNENRRMVVGINQGNGAQLLGLAFDSAVHINFEQ